MLFAQTALALLAAASVASAAAIGYSPAPAANAGALAKRSIQKRATCKVTSAQRAEARRLSSLSRKLASQQKSLSSKKSSIFAKSASVNNKSNSVSARQSSAFSSLSASSASAASASSSLSSASESLASASSALAAATSAAAANSNCYPLGQVDVTLIADATDPSSCADACGANYNVIALVEPNSPPATCFCLNADSLASLGTPVAAASCNAPYGSTSGQFVSAFAV